LCFRELTAEVYSITLQALTAVFLNVPFFWDVTVSGSRTGRTAAAKIAVIEEVNSMTVN
jgi:hypothetical protein